MAAASKQATAMKKGGVLIVIGIGAEWICRHCKSWLLDRNDIDD
jgi:hypothetical protein